MAYLENYNAPAYRINDDDNSVIIGVSDVMLNLFQEINRLAKYSVTVLIQGETGTGKDLVAKALHNNGIRKDYPYIPVNCASIPQELFESTLFGHERGSFTGAIIQKEGLAEASDKGTLFLDEIAEMPMYQQAKILRFVQGNAKKREIMPIGSTKPSYVDVRIISATNKDLEDLIKK